jgi:hypothetical protein
MKQLKCKVLLIPTKKTTSLFVDNNRKIYFGLPTGQTLVFGHHLYLISNREIKIGDYYLNAKKDKFIKASAHDVALLNTESSNISKILRYIKLEATTDRTLNLPLIPKSFAEKYADKQGSINEVLIEYNISVACTCDTTEKLFYCPFSVNDECKKRFEDGSYFNECVTVRKDNTVILERVKDIFSKSEVIDLIVNFNLKDQTMSMDEWIEKNL